MFPPGLLLLWFAEGFEVVKRSMDTGYEAPFDPPPPVRNSRRRVGPADERVVDIQQGRWRRRAAEEVHAAGTTLGRERTHASCVPGCPCVCHGQGS
jgi:hypothetical protein